MLRVGSEGVPMLASLPPTPLLFAQSHCFKHLADMQGGFQSVGSHQMYDKFIQCATRQTSDNKLAAEPTCP